MDLHLQLFPAAMAAWKQFSVLGIFLMCFLLLCDFMKRRRSWNRYPPGPASFPFIGTMLQIDHNNPHLSFTQLCKKYGNIFSLQNCWNNVVVLNGFKVIKEALVDKSEDFADRPFFAVYTQLEYRKNHGLILAKYGPSWKEQKRFILSALKDFGVGKKTLEDLVTEEAEHLCSSFSSKEGRPFDPHHLLNNAVSNIICSITFGKCSLYKEQNFQTLLNLLEESKKEESGFLTQLLHAIPALLFIPGIMQKAFRHQKELFGLLCDLVKMHKETWLPSCKRGIVDAYLEEVEKRKNDENSSFSEENLTLIIGDLFAAGTETTTSTLRWGLLYMVLHSNVQSKVQEEIDKVIGKNRPPKMEDQAKMPYTRAVIHEIQRVGDIVPLGLPHMTYRDTEVQGFFIPKGTTIVPNLSSVLKDEAMWEKPHHFHPEHFLDDKGQFAKQTGFMPFSAGRRACPGEQLARTELFLFFSRLLQHFTFRIPENHPRPSNDGYFALTRTPYTYQIQALLR
uniref:Cytochrome P450 n=1 Tax=Salvator merianae TaxID=96440 RepID=A0A8D0C8T2_SALMN